MGAGEFFKTIKKSDLSKVRSLLAKDPRLLKATDSHGLAPIHWACLNGDRRLVEYLLESGDDPSRRDGQGGGRPIHCAAQAGNKDIVVLLLARGVPIDEKGNCGNTPLHTAARDGHLELVKYLVKQGADLNAHCDNGATPLHLAVHENRREVVAFLLSSKASPNEVNDAKASPLHYAVHGGDQGIVEQLLEAGADRELRDQDGATPSVLAENLGHREIWEMLALRVQQQSAGDKEFRTGLRFDLGLAGANVDYKEALKHFRLAAEKGHRDAQNSLGYLYDNGLGVPEDKREAERWFRKAAMQGSAVAQFNMGDAYYHGYGVKKNLQEAIAWYRKSAEQGVPEAKEKLIEILGVSHGGASEKKEKVSARAMIEVATKKGWIEGGSLGFIPEIVSIQRKVTDDFLEVAIAAMTEAAAKGDPVQGMQAMRKICEYLFAKSVESVMLWADTSDGKINIGYDINDLATGNYATSLDEQRSKAAIATMRYGALLFDAHYEALTDRLMKMSDFDEEYVHEEMREAISWTQKLAVAYAMQLEY